MKTSRETFKNIAAIYMLKNIGAKYGDGDVEAITKETADLLKVKPVSIYSYKVMDGVNGGCVFIKKRVVNFIKVLTDIYRTAEGSSRGSNDVIDYRKEAQKEEKCIEKSLKSLERDLKEMYAYAYNQGYINPSKETNENE